MHSVKPIQQSHKLDISQENAQHAPPFDDQRVYDFTQNGATDPKLCVVVHKHPHQVPVKKNQSNQYHEFDEMPTSSAADFEQHYVVINTHTIKGNDQVYYELKRRM